MIYNAKRKRTISILMALIFALCVSAPMTEADQTYAKTKTIKLSKKTLTIKTKNKYKVIIKNLPKKSKVTWVVTKGKKIVSLSAKKKTSVKIKAKKNGTAKVAAKIKLSGKKKLKKLTCTIKVKIPKKADPTESPTPKPTLPPHVSPEPEPSFSVNSAGVLTGGDFDGVYSVDIPEGVKEIGKDAFSFCHTLERINIPEGVEKIDEAAFNECTRLTEVSFPSTLKTVGKEAFFECSSLENVQLNDGLVSLGEGAFFQCDSLENITIPSTVTQMGDYIFAWCNNLKTVTINADISEIPREFCEQCIELEEVTIPSSVKKIGARAFSEDYSLKTVELPVALDSIGDYAFKAAGVETLVVDSKYIGKSAFDGSSLQNFTLGDSVEVIDQSAFLYCGDSSDGLDINIPASVKKIDSFAFENCNIREFSVNSGNKYYKSVDDAILSADGKKIIAFPQKKSGTDYTVPNGVEEISEGAFENMSYTGSITMPSSVRSVREKAFMRCEASKIILSDGLKSLDDLSFSGMSNIEELVIPDSVTSIGSEAFSGMTGVKSIKLSDNLKEISECLFAGDTALTSLSIPDRVETIDATAFSSTDLNEDLSKLELGKNSYFSIVEGMLCSKDGKKLYICPDREVTEYGEKISVTIPDSIEQIGTFAVPTTYTTINIGNNIKSIDPYAIGYSNPYGASGTNISDLATETRIMSENSVAIDYANRYGVNILSEEDPDYIYGGDTKIRSSSSNPDEIVKKIELQTGETYTLNVKGVVGDHWFTSSDKKIATVDQTGKITAVAKGKTWIVETSGQMYFVLEVEVVSGNDPVYDEQFKTFENEKDDIVDAWVDTYRAFNNRIWFSSVDFPATTTYTGGDYNSVVAPYYGRESSNYKTFITNKYGEGCGEFFNRISKNLEEEISVTNLNDDLLVYSGKPAKFGVDYITKDHGFTVGSLIDSIGTTATYTGVISTSLYRKVADNFSSSPYSAIFEIELHKNKTNGMMINTFSKFPGEMEFLLNHGLRYRILDAGCKVVYERTWDEEIGDYGYLPVVKPFLRMEIL